MKSRYQGQSEKKTGGLSHNTVLSFLLRDARENPLISPPENLQSGTVHAALVSPWLDRPIGLQMGGVVGSGQSQKHREKKGGGGGKPLTAHCEVEGKICSC